MKLYNKRDCRALDVDGGHFCRHIDAMTEENLHDKAEIAAELAFRDHRISKLEAALERSVGPLNSIRADLEHTLKPDSGFATV